MFQLGKTLVSEDIIEKDFICNLSACKGACCVDGDSGAPLEASEADILKDIYPVIKPYLRKEGIAAMNPYKKQLEDKLISEKEYYKIEKKVRKGKTQEELAQLLGISKGSINKIIKNEYSAYFLKKQKEKTSNY